jgi:hypothetical protein
MDTVGQPFSRFTFVLLTGRAKPLGDLTCQRRWWREIVEFFPMGSVYDNYQP